MFKPWQLALIDHAGYNGINDRHIDRVARSLQSVSGDMIDQSTFEHHCRKNGIDPKNFTPADLKRLQQKLNEY
jgi:hypothetical protein